MCVYVCVEARVNEVEREASLVVMCRLPKLSSDSSCCRAWAPGYAGVSSCGS